MSSYFSCSSEQLLPSKKNNHLMSHTEPRPKCLLLCMSLPGWGSDLRPWKGGLGNGISGLGNVQ